MSTFPVEWNEVLCPPGNGVYTIQTAKERKEALHELLYGTAEAEQVERKWKEQLAEPGPVALLGIPSDCGGGILRGTNWGPLFLRNKFYQAARTIWELGDIRVIPHLLHDKYLNEETLASCREALYGTPDSSLPVSPLSLVEHVVLQLGDAFPETSLLAFGGDHSVSYPLSKGWLETKKRQGKRPAVIHFDAHTDLLDKRLGIDICFGSWTYHILPLLETPADVVQIGIRASGKERSHWEQQLGVRQYWPQEIESLGTVKLAEEVCQAFEARGIDEVYLSFDIDCLDSQYASCTGTPEENGLSPQQCLEMLHVFGERLNVTGADLVEVAPFTHTQQTPANPEPESTLNCGLQIASQLADMLK